MKSLYRALRKLTILVVAAAPFVFLPGCEEKKEKVLDIETPGVDIEVEKSEQDGKVEVNIDRKSRD
jgi:hypothetical protein